MTRDALCITMQPLNSLSTSVTLHDMELFGGREGIEGLHCGLHSDTQCVANLFWSPLLYNLCYINTEK